MRKRSAYKPKHIITPFMRTSLTNSDSNRLNLTSYQALDLISKGHGTYAHYDCLKTAVCVATVLCEKGYGLPYIEICHEAMHAVIRMGQRAAKTDKYAFDGEGLQACRKCPELHSQQIELCTRLTLSDAIFEVESRLRKRKVA